MGHFWIHDDFVRQHAKHLTPYDHSIYMALSSHVNKAGETFIGCRKIAEELGVNKNTVARSIENLIAYGLVIRLQEIINGRASTLKLIDVLFQQNKAYDQTIHKEFLKEEIKENKAKINTNYKGKEAALDAMQKSNPKQYQAFMNKYSNRQD